MWAYQSEIGPLVIRRHEDGMYYFEYDEICWTGAETPAIVADNVYCRATGCSAVSALSYLPMDLSEWEHHSE